MKITYAIAYDQSETIDSVVKRLNAAIKRGELAEFGVIDVKRADDVSKIVQRFDNLDDMLSIPAALRAQEEYRLLDVVGSGGMGIVYKAQHALTGRLVALKVIQGNLFGLEDTKARFLREAHALTRLDHPHVVRIYDVVLIDDLVVLVMEYLEGLSLADLAQRKQRMPWMQACKFILQAAAGLQHAHEHGLVHRDVKPDNLRLTISGEVKVVDFGLACYINQKAVSQSLTGTNAVVGTPEFMAPEQAVDPAKASVQADLYALGCTFFCLLTGQPPFRGTSLMETLIAHAKQMPRPLDQWRHDVPSKVEGLLHRLLAKDPTERPQSAAEVVSVLQSFIQSQPETLDVSNLSSSQDSPPHPTGKRNRDKKA